MNEIFIEAESFRNLGGWVVDQQSMEMIHSSYVMAHGMGVPVADATTEFFVTEGATYTVWALTRDWTAPWDVKDPAGKFNIIIDDKKLPETLGTNGKDWAWQSAGELYLEAGNHKVALHDITGFNGRCDAIYLTSSKEAPSNEIESLRQRLNWKTIVDHEKEYDLIVCGGGIAGMCTALSASREGLNVLLINDRDVLGGCNSSEIRVCLGGQINLPPYDRIGDVVREIAPIMGSPTTFDAKYYEDDRKKQAFENLKEFKFKCDISYNESITDVEQNGEEITSVVTTNTLTGKKKRYFAKLFCDATGDAIVSRLCGAEVMYGREPKDTFNESLAPDTHENLVMGHSIRWHSEQCEEKTDFPIIDWNLKFDDNTCLNVYNGDWEQESGFYRNMVSEIEYIRDFGLRAIYSNWSYQKNFYKFKDQFENYSLKWVSPYGGKRESYRVVGDYIVNQNDIENHIPHEDGTACISWSIDMHFPEPDNVRDFGEPFRSYAYHRGYETPYQIPYRCLYSKDINNLFLGGRIVSASHVAFSAIRVMRTLGMLGEVVGMASGICMKNNCKPREIYTNYLDEFKDKLKSGVKITHSFQGRTGSEEAYHFKDAGWFNLNPYLPIEQHMEKYKRGVKNLGLNHKHPLPDEFYK